MDLSDLFAASIPPFELVARLGLAMLCGGLLGLDRELRGKPAGLRTHTLVAISSAATTMVALEFTGTMGDRAEIDPTRVIQGIAQAVGFISAGVIIREGASVQGATTAAVVWVAGALGIACGAGFYAIALVTLAFALSAVVSLTWLERRILKRRED